MMTVIYGREEERSGAVQMTGDQLEQLALREQQELSVAFIAFARVYSGTVRPGQEVLVIGPKYDPALTGDLIEAGELPAESHIARCKLGSLYMLLHVGVTWRWWKCWT